MLRFPEKWANRIKISTDLFFEGTPCWQWTGWNSGTGAGRGRGYGKVSDKGRAKMAHRAMHEYMVGPIPAGLEIDHRCKNRGCVNPLHHRRATRLQNMENSTVTLYKTKESYCASSDDVPF